MPQLPFEPSMRVGIISAEYPPAVGGVGDHSARLARELTALGHTVQVVTSHGPAQEGDEPQAACRARSSAPELPSCPHQKKVPFCSCSGRNSTGTCCA